MARKTVDVEFVKERVNIMLDSDFTTSEMRRGAFGVLEAVLFKSGNYKGFSYLPSELDDDGRLKPDYDDTRRKYS